MSVEWMLIRGSGFVAFGLLAVTTIWGLVLSLGLFPQFTTRITFGHESLSIGALLATVVHMVALGTHDYIDFDLAALLVPGASSWGPLAVASGIVAFYGMILVTVSFYVRKHIGQRYWRLLHFTSFGVFAGATAHGIGAGTDSGHPLVFAFYLTAAGIVVGLTALRVVMILNPPPAWRRSAAKSHIPEEVPAGADA